MSHSTCMSLRVLGASKSSNYIQRGFKTQIGSFFFFFTHNYHVAHKLACLTHLQNPHQQTWTEVLVDFNCISALMTGLLGLGLHFRGFNWLIFSSWINKNAIRPVKNVHLLFYDIFEDVALSQRHSIEMKRRKDVNLHLSEVVCCYVFLSKNNTSSKSPDHFLEGWNMWHVQ